MLEAWTLDEWRALLEDHPELAKDIWYDPNSHYSEAKQHNTWLHMAILMSGMLSRNDNERREIVRLLLNSGADPNAKNDFRETALHLVCGAEHRESEVAKILLEHGADPLALTSDGKSPMDLLGEDSESGDEKGTQFIFLHLE